VYGLDLNDVQRSAAIDAQQRWAADAGLLATPFRLLRDLREAFLTVNAELECPTYAPTNAVRLRYRGRSQYSHTSATYSYDVCRVQISFMTPVRWQITMRSLRHDTITAPTAPTLAGVCDFIRCLEQTYG
jgi:hypothetical protein